MSKHLDKPLAERLRDEEVRYFGQEALNDEAQRWHERWLEARKLASSAMKDLGTQQDEIERMTLDRDYWAGIAAQSTRKAANFRMALERIAALEGFNATNALGIAREALSTAPDSPREPPK